MAATNVVPDAVCNGAWNFARFHGPSHQTVVASGLGGTLLPHADLFFAHVCVHRQASVSQVGKDYDILPHIGFFLFLSLAGE